MKRLLSLLLVLGLGLVGCGENDKKEIKKDNNKSYTITEPKKSTKENTENEDVKVEESKEVVEDEVSDEPQYVTKNSSYSDPGGTSIDITIDTNSMNWDYQTTSERDDLMKNIIPFYEKKYSATHPYFIFGNSSDGMPIFTYSSHDKIFHYFKLDGYFDFEWNRIGW